MLRKRSFKASYKKQGVISRRFNEVRDVFASGIYSYGTDLNICVLEKKSLLTTDSFD